MQEKIKLVWLQTHLTNWAGGTRFIFEVLKELSKSYDVSLVVENYDEKLARLFKSHNISVDKLGFISSDNLLYWILFPLIIIYEYIRLRKLVGKHTILISCMFPMNILANWINSQHHIQYIFEPYAFFHDPVMIKGLPFTRRIFVKILKFCYSSLDISSTKKSRYLMTINDGVEKWVEKIYGRKAYKSYLVVDTDFFRHIDNIQLKEKYKNRKIVLHSTDYTPLKRTPFLIEAFKDVVKQVPESLLMIIQPVNNDREKDKLEKMVLSMGISKNVVFAGCVAADDLPKYYSLACCSVYPGIGAGASASSYFVLESMACMTPVVRTWDTKEEVIDKVNGYLFDPNNKSEMVSLLVKLLRNKEIRDIFGRMARDRIIRVNSVANVVTRFEYLIKKL